MSSHGPKRPKIRTLKPRVATLNTSIGAHFGISTNADRLRGRRRQTRAQRVFARYPICLICDAEGRVRPSVEADHFHSLADGGRDHEANMVGLCREDHVRKTADEIARRSRGEDTSQPLPWLPPMKPTLDPGFA